MAVGTLYRQAEEGHHARVDEMEEAEITRGTTSGLGTSESRVSMIFAMLAHKRSSPPLLYLD